MQTVFISHANQDAQFAHRLAADLQRLGVQVWIAPESIRPGEGWVSAIERGLEESSHVVVVVTPAALESRWVKKETDIAIAQERKGLIQVIPLDMEPCKVPLLLSSYQMVSLHRDYDAGFNQLADILGVRVTQPKPATLPRQTSRPAGLVNYKQLVEIKKKLDDLAEVLPTARKQIGEIIRSYDVAVRTQHEPTALFAVSQTKDSLTKLKDLATDEESVSLINQILGAVDRFSAFT